MMVLVWLMDGYKYGGWMDELAYEVTNTLMKMLSKKNYDHQDLHLSYVLSFIARHSLAS